MANKKELVIGIDIGTHAVKVCQLQLSGKEGYRLLAEGSAALPAEAVEDGDLKELEGTTRRIILELARGEIGRAHV